MKKSLLIIVFAFLIAVFSSASVWAGVVGGTNIYNQYADAAMNAGASKSSSSTSSGCGGSSIKGKGIAWYVNQNQWTTERCQMGRFKDHKCWSCPLFKSIFNTASILTSSSFGKFKSGLRSLVVLATAIWLAIYLLKKLPEFSGLDWRKMSEETSSQIFRTLIIVILLSSQFSVVRSLTLDPVFDTGMQITQYFAGGFECNNESEGINGDGLSASMGQGLICSVYNIEMEALQIVDLGRQAWCLSVEVDPVRTPLFHIYIFPNVHLLISGLAYMALGLTFAVGCPFLLIDCIINMLFAGALIPFGIACYAFESTKKHLKTIWNTFMAAAFNFVFMSVVLYIMFKCVENIISEGLCTPSTSGVENMMKVLGVATMNFFKIGFIFMLGWSALSGINDFAGSWAEGGGITSGKGMGGGLGTTALSVGKSTGLTAAKAGGVIAKGGGRAIAATRRLARGRRFARQAGLGGDLVKVKTYGKFRSFLRGGRGGNIIKRQVYVNGVLLTQKIRVDANGAQTILSSTSEIFDKSLRKELNKPAGEMNTAVINKFISGAGNNKDAATQAIMLQLFQQRMNKGSTGINIGKSAKGASFRTEVRDGRTHYIMEQSTGKGGKGFSMDMAIGDGVVYTGLTEFDKGGNITRKYETNGIATRIERRDGGKMYASNGIASDFQGSFRSDGSHSKDFSDEQLNFGMEGNNTDFSKSVNRKNFAAFN